VLVIKMWSWHRCYKKLASVCCWTGVGHGYCERTIMTKATVCYKGITDIKCEKRQSIPAVFLDYSLSNKFIFKFPSPDTFSPCPVAQWITCLNHKALDNTMCNRKN
jgi:hypothetical protein